LENPIKEGVITLEDVVDFPEEDSTVNGSASSVLECFSRYNLFNLSAFCVKKGKNSFKKHVYLYRSGYYLHKLKLKRKINDNLVRIFKNKKELAFYSNKFGFMGRSD